MCEHEKTRSVPPPPRRVKHHWENLSNESLSLDEINQLVEQMWADFDNICHECRRVGGNVTDNELDLSTLLPDPNCLDGSTLPQELNRLDAVSTHTVLKGRT